MKISQEVRDEIQAILDDIKAGRKKWHQNAFFSRDSDGNLCSCIGGWKIIQDYINHTGQEPDDWDSYGKSDKINKYVQKTHTQYRKYLADKWQIPAIEVGHNFLAASLTLEKIQRNLDNFEIINPGLESRFDTLNRRKQELELQLCQVEVEIQELLPRIGDHYYQPDNESTYVLTSINSAFYLVNVKTGLLWFVQGEKVLLKLAKKLQEQNFQKV